MFFIPVVIGLVIFFFARCLTVILSASLVGWDWGARLRIVLLGHFSLTLFSFSLHGGHREVRVLGKTLSPAGHKPHSQHRSRWPSWLECSRPRLTGAVGTGDAAQTAVLCGFLNALFSALLMFLGPEGSVRVVPDFQKTVFSLRFSCIIRLRFAHIRRIVSGVKEKANGKSSD